MISLRQHIPPLRILCSRLLSHTTAFIFLLFTPLSAEEHPSLPWDTQLITLSGASTSLDPWKGDVLLIVNISVENSLTTQLFELQELYQLFQDRGFTVLAFLSSENEQPSFLSLEELAHIYCARYALSFPLFQPISARGSDIHPFYQWLTDPYLHGSLGGEIAWSFTKLLINRKGQLIDRFPPCISPLSPIIRAVIEQQLDIISERSD